MLKRFFDSWAGIVIFRIVPALLFCAALIVGVYSVFGQRFLLPGVTGVSGFASFTLLTLVVPVFIVVVCSAGIYRIIVHFKIKEVLVLLGVVLLVDTVVTTLLMAFTEAAPRFLPITPYGVKKLDKLPGLVQTALLMGTLTGAKQIWSGHNDHKES